MSTPSDDEARGREAARRRRDAPSLSLFSSLKARAQPLLDMYKHVVVSGADVMASTENMMRYSLYLIPFQRVTDKASETVIEGAYASIGLLSLLHDLIYVQHARDVLRSLHCRLLHTVGAGELSAAYRQQYEVPSDVLLSMPPEDKDSLSVALSTVTCCELFVEMYTSATYGSKDKWQAIFVVEVIKAFIRVLTLVKNNGSVVVQSHATVPARASLVSRVQQAKDGVKAVESSSPAFTRPTLLDHARRAGCSVDRVPSHSGSSTSFALVLSELINIIRPVFYVFCLMVSTQSTREGKGWRAWLPFMFTLALDLAGKRLAQLHTFTAPLNDVEDQEMARRRSLLLLYVLRSPFYDVLASVFSKITPSKLQVIGGYIQTYRNYYFYTSGS